MAIGSKKKGLSDQVIHSIFYAAESAGISDREKVEHIVREVIHRVGITEVPLPGMEEFTTGRMPRKVSNQVEKEIKEVIASLGYPEIADALQIKPSERAENRSYIDLSANALHVLEKRYLRKDAQGRVVETPQEMFQRVAKAVASAEPIFDPSSEVGNWEEKFYSSMVKLEFLPNSPTLMNAGRELGQLSACFVLPVEDSMGSIFEEVKHTALIHKSGGGTGFSFSHIRPEGDLVGSTGGVASGPVSFIRVFDAATDVIKQGGMRRGANMAILDVHHPDILKFISAKEEEGVFQNFNFSVGITEDFMEAVEKDEEYSLVNPRTDEERGRIKAKEVFHKITEGAWRTGEPGIVFLDRINRDNPVPHLGKIESTNPCGEQPLLPFESCNLGSINLAKMVHMKDGKAEINYPQLSQVIRMAVRFLDNIIEINKFPLPEIEKRTKATRKIGLGVMGFADMLILLDIPYDSPEAIKAGEEIMQFINKEAFKASCELAELRGPFPAFSGSIYDIPEGPKVRNATQTTIAPTGTLSIIASCSSGIEPLFSLVYTRHILDGENLMEVNPSFEKAIKREELDPSLWDNVVHKGSVRGVENIPPHIQKLFPTSHDIEPEFHVRMQAAFQKHTNNAVSKTINLPHQATVEDVSSCLQLAYSLGCKGLTIYRDQSRREQVLTRQEEVEKEKLAPRRRGRKTWGSTSRVSTGCGYIYVTVNYDEEGICEVFSTLGKAGGCASAQLEAISRLISLNLRSGISLPSIIKQLKGIRCPQISWEEGHSVISCADAIARVLEEEMGKEENSPQNPIFMGGCPECGGTLTFEEGCFICRSCGYTKCS